MEKIDYDPGIGKIVSTWKILEVVSDHSELEDFARDRGYSKEEISMGYALFIEAGIRNILDNQTLDEHFYANSENLKVASRKGEYLKNLARKHPKEKFLYGIKRYINRLNGASRQQDWEQITETVDDVEDGILTSLNKIYEEHTEFLGKDEQEVLYNMVLEDFLDFIDMQSGCPQAHYSPILEDKFGDRAEEALRGYAVTAIYFLDNFLRDEEKKKVDYMQYAEVKDWKKPANIFGEDEPTYEDHEYLDRLWSEMTEKVFRDDDSDLYFIAQDRMQDGFYKPDSKAKEYLEHIEDDSENPPDNKEEELRQKLWLYPVEIIGFQQERGFNGVSGILPLLTGMYRLRKSQGVDNPIKVMRFKHPHNEEKSQNYISYGILNEHRGAFSDGSGWLIFPKCATDFSGTGNQQRMEVEKTLEVLDDGNLLKTKEMIVDYNKFEELLADYDVSDKAKAQDKINTLEEEKSDFQGLTSEFITYYILNEKHEDEKSVKLDHNPNGKSGQQIDVAILQDGCIETIVECKFDANSFEAADLVNQLHSKSQDIPEEPILQLWTYIELDGEKSKILRKQGVGVKCIKRVLEENTIEGIGNLSVPDNLKSLMEKESSVVNPQLPTDWEKWEDELHRD